MNKIIKTDNRDIHTTILVHENHSTKTEVNPVDLFNNALVNAGDPETEEQTKNLQEFVNLVLSDLIEYVQDSMNVADDPWDMDPESLVEDFGLCLESIHSTSND